MKKINGGATIWARKTIDSIIFYDKPADWFKIWFFIVNQVNHKEYRKWGKGQGFMTYSQIMEKTKTTKNQVDMCLRFLKKEQMLTTHKTTRGMNVEVLNYQLYQDLNNYKNDTENETETKPKRNRNDTINKNDKNDNNDKKERGSSVSFEYSKSFLSFWEVYPRKVGKGEAFKVWKKVKLPALTSIVEAVEAQIKSSQWKKENGRFIPNPATWLNQRRWEDEVEVKSNNIKSYV